MPGASVAFADHRADAIAQRKTAQAIARSPSAAAQRAVSAGVHASPRMLAQRQRFDGVLGEASPVPNRTGLPDTLKSGVESLSGMSLDHVKVHYNSSQPAQLNALAYAATMQMKSGVPVNDGAGPEREADVMGARAVQLYRTGYRIPPSQRQAAPGGGGTVQRKVGFEFETQWDLRKPQNAAWTTDTPLARGLHWQMSPDEIAGNDAKIEFKTAPFDLDGDDTMEMVTPIMEAFESLDHYIQGQLLPLPEGQFSPVATTPRGMEVQPVGELEAKPQVTGGVRTDVVLRFLRDLARSDKQTDLMPGDRKKQILGEALGRAEGKVDENDKDSREYWGVVVLLANLVMRFQEDAKQALQAYVAWRTETAEDLRTRYQAWLERVDPDEEAREQKKLQVKEHFDTLKLEKQEEIRREQTPSYAKARASALPRIAFNALPQVTADTLLRDVLETAGLEYPDGGDRRMFPLGMKRDRDVAMTITQWITLIQQPIGMGETGHLWSSRSLGTGPVGTGDRQGTGIPFELRGIPGSLPHADWLQFAIPFITYFVKLNERSR